MRKSLPSQKKLVPISEAANVLGVSIDTIRRWDKSGVLRSQRSDGKNRYFSLDELKKHKSSRPLPISEAAKKLGISPTTLRRLEAKGIFKPDRNNAGERVYDRDSLENFLNGPYFNKKSQDAKGDSELLPELEELPENSPAPNWTTDNGHTELDKPLIKNTNPSLSPLRRIPELFAACVIYLLLVALGIRNISISTPRVFQPSSNSAVLSVMETQTPGPSPTSSPPEISDSEDIVIDQKHTENQSTEDITSPKPADTVIQNPPEEVIQKPDGGVSQPEGEIRIKIIRIKITEEGQDVIIRKSPSDLSEAVGKANNGDTFELVSLESGWYMVKLSYGEFGFISDEFAEEGEVII